MNTVIDTNTTPQQAEVEAPKRARSASSNTQEMLLFVGAYRKFPMFRISLSIFWYAIKLWLVALQSAENPQREQMIILAVDDRGTERVIHEVVPDGRTLEEFYPFCWMKSPTPQRGHYPLEIVFTQALSLFDRAFGHPASTDAIDFSAETRKRAKGRSFRRITQAAEWLLSPLAGFWCGFFVGLSVLVTMTLNR